MNMANLEQSHPDMLLVKQWWFFRSIVVRKPIWKGSDGPKDRRDDK